MSRDFLKEAEALEEAYAVNISRTATDCINFAVSRAEKLLKGLHVEIIFGMGSQNIKLTFSDADDMTLQYWGDATFTLEKISEASEWIASDTHRGSADPCLYKVCEILAKAVADIETITNYYRTGCPESVGV